MKSDEEKQARGKTNETLYYVAGIFDRPRNFFVAYGCGTKCGLACMDMRKRASYIETGRDRIAGAIVTPAFYADVEEVLRHVPVSGVWVPPSCRIGEVYGIDLEDRVIPDAEA